MPAYPVQKKRKLSNEASEPTALYKKKTATKTGKAAPAPKKTEVEPEHDSGNDSDKGHEEDKAGVEDVGDAAEEEVEKTFADLGLTDSLCEACATLGFKKPTPIQRESLPIALSG